MKSVIMMRFEIIPLHQLIRIKDPTQFSSKWNPSVQNQNVPTSAVQINILQPMPSFRHPELPQFEEEISKGLTKVSKEKGEELERQLK